MSTTIEVSKIINEVSFRINNNEYRKATDRIKKIAGLFSKSTNQYTKSMDAGKRMANMQAKASDKATRSEIRQQRARKESLRADNIRYQQQIKSNAEFQKGLQKINSDFLLGNKSFKERSAAIGVLNREYRKLNQSASKHSGIVSGIRGIAGRAGSTAAGTAALGAGVMGASAYAATRGFDSVKAGGQQFEQLNIKLENVFEGRAIQISNVIANMANKMGQPIVELGNQLVDSVSIMKALGVSTDEAIKLFELQTNATASLTKEQKGYFNYGASQMLASNTFEDFKQAFDNATELRTALFKYVHKKYGIDQGQFTENITNKKYNLKEIWFGFLKDTQDEYAKKAKGFQRSSMATDARTSNAVSVAVYRIFESSGFKQAMESASKIVGYWGNLLETNAGKIGDVFGNLYGITEDLSKQGFKELSDWLQQLTKEDIQGYFGDLKNSMMQFTDVMRRLFAFLDSVLPKQTISDQKGQYYIQREKYWLDQGYSGQEAGRLADGEMRKQFNLGFTVPTLENSLVRMSAQNTQSNHQATLDLKINTEVNQPRLDQYVWATIAENDNRNFNLAFSY